MDAIRKSGRRGWSNRGDPDHQFLCFVGVASAVLSISAQAMECHAQPPAAQRNTLSRLKQLNPHLAENGGPHWALKVGSLSRGPSDFFRGTAGLFTVEAGRIAGDWQDDSLPPVLLHRDVHLGNIGTYQGVGPTSKAIHFGLVDFDEAVVGPFELDLLRGATSLRFASAEERLKLSESMMSAAIVAMCNSYAESLRNPPTDETLASQFSDVTRLLRKAKKGKLDKYIAKFTQGQPLRFRHVCIKGRKISDIMDSVDDATRNEIFGAVWWYLEHGVGTQTRQRYRFSTREELAKAVLDVAAWTRVGSSGSQGLHKYLVLLNEPLIDVPGPLILQLKEEPIPGAARAQLVQSNSGVERAQEVAEASLQVNPEPLWLVGFTRIGDRGSW